MTHFKPAELGVSVAKLRSIGYLTDYMGKPLENENQVLELKVQDIVISDNEEFSSVNYMLNVSRFIDELLVKFYCLPPYYEMIQERIWWDNWLWGLHRTHLQA